MEYQKLKLLTWMFLSFALVLLLFLGIILGIYFFSINASKQFAGFIKEVPVTSVLAYGGLAGMFYYIAKKYKFPAVAVAKPKT